MKKPILCLDFDGVIHSYESGWKGVGVVYDDAVPGAIAFIENAQNAGFIVAIYSARSKSFRGRRAMKAWIEPLIIERFGIDRAGADSCFGGIRWPWFKPAAFLTIDDRAITFGGKFPDPRGLHFFRTWNEVIV